MISNISHDLRTPLTCLHGYLETLQGKAPQLSRDERRQFTDAALRHSKHLGAMIEDLFELARLDARIVEVHTETFSAAELLQDLAQKYRPKARQQGIALHARLPANSPFVSADLGMIDRVLDNLIGNALAHTPKGGKIIVDLRRRGEKVAITVLNTGSGIDQSDLPFVFERFYRGKTSPSQSDRHLGLGLAIAQRIVQLHGSAIEVGSTGNQRTWFQFALPTV